MRMRRNILYWVAAVLLLTACNESLEDTYSDFAGDGKIRYVAKCTEVHATPGWERLMVDWINGTDATIDKIKVVWSCEERRDSVMLPGESTSYELTNLEDGHIGLMSVPWMLRETSLWLKQPMGVPIRESMRLCWHSPEGLRDPIS